MCVRSEESMPLLDDLKKNLELALNKTGGKSPLAQAVRYMLSRWDSLTRYTTDGRLEMTNNLDPEAYLRKVITQIPDHPINKIDQLLPWNCQ